MGITKLRTFLLEGKALIYDLEFLDVASGQLFDFVNSIIDLRGRWFLDEDSGAECMKLIDPIFVSLEKFLKNEIIHRHLFLPKLGTYLLSRNVSIIQSQTLSVEHKGFVLPSLGILPERKFFNFLHRINTFKVNLPYQISHKESVVKARFDLLSEMRAYNQKNIPNFLIPSSSLRII